MTITQEKALKAYAALTELMQMHFQLRDAYNLTKLRRSMGFIYEFQAQEENKLVDEFQPEVRDGKYIFANTKGDNETTYRAKAFQEKLNEIGKMTIEIDVEPIVISIAGNEGIHVSPETLLALDGFVSFD